MADTFERAPIEGDVNRAPTLVGGFGAMTTLSISCVAARIYTRFRLLRMPAMDDAVILFSIVGAVHQEEAHGNAHLYRF